MFKLNCKTRNSDSANLESKQKDLRNQVEQERQSRHSAEQQLHEERQKLRVSLRGREENGVGETNCCSVEEAYQRLKNDSIENLVTQLGTYQTELTRTRNSIKDERSKWLEENEDLRTQTEQLAHEAKLNAEALEAASLQYTSEINGLHQELRTVCGHLEKARGGSRQVAR